MWESAVSFQSTCVLATAATSRAKPGWSGKEERAQAEEEVGKNEEEEGKKRESEKKESRGSSDALRLPRPKRETAIGTLKKSKDGMKKDLMGNRYTSMDGIKKDWMGNRYNRSLVSVGNAGTDETVLSRLQQKVLQASENFWMVEPAQRVLIYICAFLCARGGGGRRFRMFLENGRTFWKCVRTEPSTDIRESRNTSASLFSHTLCIYECWVLGYVPRSCYLFIYCPSANASRPS